MLFPHQQEIIEASRSGNTKRAVLDKDFITPWPNATVPYVMDPKIIGKCRDHSGYVSGYSLILHGHTITVTFLLSIGTKYERSFKKAIDIWEKYTCVNFVNRTNERFYVKLTNYTM